MATTRTNKRTYHLKRGDTTTSSTTTSSSTTATSSSTTTNTTTTTTNGRDSDDILMDVELIKKRYYDCLGTTMPEYLASQVHGYLQGNTIPCEYFLFGLQEAATAPRPSWRYAMAVVRRLAQERYPVGLLPVSWM